MEHNSTLDLLRLIQVQNPAFSWGQSELYKKLEKYNSTFSLQKTNLGYGLISNEPFRISVYQLSDNLRFGKHKGDNLYMVFLVEPDYIFWCIEHLDWFAVEPDFFFLSEVILKDQILEVAEINFIKLNAIGLWECREEEASLKYELGS
jgi:hypothetical protein